MHNNIPLNIQEIIQKFINGVNSILGDRVRKIILFGSYARGDFNEYSDIDIMILTNLSDEEIVKYREKIWNYAYDLEFDNDFNVQLSPLLKNEEKFNYWLEALPFYQNVSMEGVVLSEF